MQVVYSDFCSNYHNSHLQSTFDFPGYEFECFTPLFIHKGLCLRVFFR
jgi:hypothetical protein